MTRNATIEFVKGLIRPVAMFLVPRLVYRRRLSLYDPEREMDLLPIIVPRGREAVDVGANIGAYSVALSSLASHIYAFEPIPGVSSYISKVLPDNVTVRNLAVSDTIGVSDLFVPFKDGKEDTPFAHIAVPTDSGGSRCRVQTTTLDTLADHDVGFLKIDVEGHEMNVLRGASELIAKRRPSVLIEAEDRHRENAVQSVFAFFADRNYQGFFVLDDDLMAVSKFNSSMQDIVRLSGNHDRRKSAYVNNFIFIPAERCGDDLVKAMEIALNNGSRMTLVRNWRRALTFTWQSIHNKFRKQ